MIEEEDKDRIIATLTLQLAEKEETITNLIEDSKASKELLKKQLAEKDKAIKEWQTMYEGVTRTCANDYKEILRLRGELIEKEKQLRTKIGNMKTNDFIKMCSQCGLMVDAKEKDNQDKISFAVEQLKFLKNEIEMMGTVPRYTVLTERELICRFDVFCLIDNQIKQLKEMK